MNKDNINEFASFDEYLRQGWWEDWAYCQIHFRHLANPCFQRGKHPNHGDFHHPISPFVRIWSEQWNKCPKLVPSSSQVEELIISINKDYLSIGDIMNLFGLKNRTRFRKEYITPALAEGALEMKYPNTPRHPRQQYRMTEQAKTWKEGNEKKNK